VQLKLLRPLRNRDFALLWSGMTVSLLGDGVAAVALAWITYSISNHPSSLAWVGAAQTVPRLAFLLYGGVLSDRLERRTMMGAAHAIRALATGAIATLALTGSLQLWHIIVLGSIEGLGGALFAPAFGAIVPELVPAEQLVQANSLDNFFRPVIGLVGPAIGGVAVAAFGAGGAFLFDSGTFVFALATLLPMTRRPMPRVEGVRPSAFRELAEGLAFVRSHTWLWATLVGAAVGNITRGAVFVLVPFIVKNELDAGAQVYGLVLSVGAVGAIAVSLLLGQLGLPRRHIAFMYLSWNLASGVIAGYAVARNPAQAMAVSILEGALLTAGAVVWSTLMHVLVPRELLGRVSSFDWLVSLALMPAAYAVIGPLAEWIGVDQALIVSAIVGTTVGTAFLLFLPGLRDPEHDPRMIAARAA
jgi:MFS family permease